MDDPLISAHDRAKAIYVPSKSAMDWRDSRYLWMRPMSGDAKGDVGEIISTEMLVSLGGDARRLPQGGRGDILCNGVYVEVKTSMASFDGSGKYARWTLNQLRDDAYEYVLALLLHPCDDDSRVYLIPKAILWDEATDQHGGNTRSLNIPCPPRTYTKLGWLECCGGTPKTFCDVARDKLNL